MKDIVKTVSARVIPIYIRASIPAVSVMRVNELIMGYHTKYRNLIKNYKSQINSSNQSHKFYAFKEYSNRLFDFAACKCKAFECLDASKIRKYLLWNVSSLLIKELREKCLLEQVIQQTLIFTNDLKQESESPR